MCCAAKEDLDLLPLNRSIDDFQRAQPLCFIDAHAAKLGFPRIECPDGHTVFASQFVGLDARIGFTQDANNPLFGDLFRFMNLPSSCILAAKAQVSDGLENRQQVTPVGAKLPVLLAGVQSTAGVPRLERPR